LDEKGIQNLIKAWHGKASGEKDIFSKFMSLWICFNAWLTFRAPNKESDRKMINWLKSSDGQNSDLFEVYQNLLTKTKFRDDLKTLATYSPFYDPNGIRSNGIGCCIMQIASNGKQQNQNRRRNSPPNKNLVQKA
jgi:hypothetical protein